MEDGQIRRGLPGGARLLAIAGFFWCGISFGATSKIGWATLLVTPLAVQDSTAGPPAQAAVPFTETTPGPRLGHSMAFDETGRRVVLVDGAWPQAESAAGRVWSWTGERWESIAAAGPPPTAMGAAVFDARRQRLVTYGGVVNGSAFGKLWEWSSEWRVAADLAPGARFHHAMAYDAARAKTVMYGGAISGRWDSDTWQWDGSSWNRLTVPGPGPRAAFRLAYDGRRGQVVLFGGVAPPSADGLPQPYLSDTWVWNGVSWRKASDSGPAGRRDYSMTFDARRGVVLLYGGAAGSGPATQRFRDMWAWDGTRWSEVPLTAPNPGHRYVSAMAYDAARDRVVLYGGYSCARGNEECGVVGDTWEWTGARWSQGAASR